MTIGSGNRVVLGLQWGDEGKGKVIDLLAGSTDVVVRCQGGANAGHTVVVGGRKTVLHLLPSGVLHPGATCIIGNGVVIDPKALCDELDDLIKGGCDVMSRLKVSDRAHLVLPVHKALDAAAEAAKGDSKVGTTLRGIGPTYVDKASRTGIRCGDMANWDGFITKLRAHVRLMNLQLKALGAAPLDETAGVEAVLPYCKRIAPLIADTAAIVHDAAAAGKRFMFEGAQGVMLDIDYGSYPFVTSSNTGVGGIITGAGLSHKYLGEVIGVAKAYCTRVGSGPFPTELADPLGTEIRTKGGEFGATTGRPRRCGWFDAVAVRFACRLNGVDSLAITKLDILTGQKVVPICVAYELDGRRIDTIPANIEEFARVKPVFEEFPGWTESLSSCRRLEDLPATARSYLASLERIVGVPARWIGVGPGRDEIIVR